MNRIDLSVLPEKVRQVLEILEKRPLWKDFYLAGGSGLAIQIFHRPSFDLDLFSEKNPLSRSERGKILDSLRPLGRLEIQTNEEGTLRVICEEVGIAFFHYPYPLIKPLVEYKRVRIASLMDIGLMKLSAIVGRGSKKDFIDIYFLLKDHISLDKLLKFAKEKFGEMRDFSIQALRALVYFTDAELEPLPEMLKKVSWEEVKEFIRDEVVKVTQRRLGIE